MCKYQLNIKASDICKMLDKTAIEIKNEFTKFIYNPSIEAANLGLIGQYFIFYSGHRRLDGEKTMGND